MKIGVFGGTFDPLHVGHLLLAESCREQCCLERVIFVPSGIPPHKKAKKQTNGFLRAEMLEAAIAGYSDYSVSRFEIDRTEISFTVNTLRHFKMENPNDEFFLILGADMYNDLPKWHCSDEILQLATPIVALRQGEPEPKAENIISMPQIEISSSAIRKRVSEGKSVRFWVPQIVEKMIFENKLYALESTNPACRLF